MKLTKRFMTRNDCYTAGRKIKPKGIMVHSTATPGVMAAQWFDRWNKSYKAGEISIQACVHAFVDHEGIWQYLPWDHRAWHCGASGNDTHISFEICEPPGFKYVNNQMSGYDPAAQEAYFRAAWKNAVELCALLCSQLGLNESHILCHSEGYKTGIASNHADVMHWFPKHGESMDTFRAAVGAALAAANAPNLPAPQPAPVLDNTPAPWAAEAVDWATKAGLLTGDQKGDLMLRSYMTREQFCTVLKRYHDMIFPPG